MKGDFATVALTQKKLIPEVSTTSVIVYLSNAASVACSPTPIHVMRQASASATFV